MPFLKKRSRVQPLWKTWERMTLKTGLRHAVFTPSGDRYIGNWLLNKKHGKGALSTHTGKLYEGDWEAGLRHGYGVLSVLQGDDQNYVKEYAGHWYRGRKEGFGVSHYKGGGYYEGFWKNGQRWGYGRQWFPDGRYYEGQWVKDKFHGLGMMVYPNRNRYEGEWIHGTRQGYGRYFHLDSGQVQSGAWNHNTCVTSTMEDLQWRQSSWDPTPYVIRKCELKDPDGVYEEMARVVLSKKRKHYPVTTMKNDLQNMLFCGMSSIEL